MTLKNRVNVKNAGHEYTLVGVESNDYIQKVASYIDKKYGEVILSNKNLSSSMSAILTSINVADDYFKTLQMEKSANKDLMNYKSEIEKLKEEVNKLTQEKDILQKKNNSLNVDLAKRELELNEMRVKLGNNSNVKPYVKYAK